jgi:serine/threonine protein kinase
VAATALAEASARVTPAAADLLALMLEYDPAKRITAQEALRHPYFVEELPRPGKRAFVGGGGLDSAVAAASASGHHHHQQHQRPPVYPRRSLAVLARHAGAMAQAACAAAEAQVIGGGVGGG